MWIILVTICFRTCCFDALFLISAFRSEISRSCRFYSVSERTRIIKTSAFTVNYSFKVSPSARRVSAANAICKAIDIFNIACTCTFICSFSEGFILYI